jgi:hypothetical protein
VECTFVKDAVLMLILWLTNSCRADAVHVPALSAMLLFTRPAWQLFARLVSATQLLLLLLLLQHLLLWMHQAAADLASTANMAAACVHSLETPPPDRTH